MINMHVWIFCIAKPSKVSTTYITIASSRMSHFMYWILIIIVEKCKLNKIL